MSKSLLEKFHIYLEYDMGIREIKKQIKQRSIK